LHVEQALQSINWNSGPTKPVQPQPIAGLPESVRGELLVSCPYFELSRLQLTGTLQVGKISRPTIWMVISGQARLTAIGDAQGYGRVFSRGESVLVPASGGELAWIADASVELLRVDRF
jgi:mannose-6-phosphate isomerase class I